MRERISVHDRMQQNYDYELVERMGGNFHPDFQPALSPQEMLEMGVFEGKYMTDCQEEFPREWFRNARLSPEGADVSCNYFGVKSRQSLAEWRRKGWIREPDPRGWFQWYCRYYMGRRLEEIDALQIKRWRAFKRHQSQVMKNCDRDDYDCRPRQRQALLQWAYDPFC